MPACRFYLIEDEGMDLAAPKRPHVPLVFESREASLAQLNDAAGQLRRALAVATDEHLAQNFPFRYGEHMISNANRILTYRQMFFNHLVHHTAQLGVYLRLNDIPVPALYGPSADEQWVAG